MNGELVFILWRDANFDFESDADDDEDAGGFRDDYLVSTVGFVVRDNDEWISIAQERLPDGDGWRAVTHIPQVLVRERTPLNKEPM